MNVQGTVQSSNPEFGRQIHFGEIRSAKFEAPKRRCVARALIFTYKRSF